MYSLNLTVLSNPSAYAIVETICISGEIFLPKILIYCPLTSVRFILFLVFVCYFLCRSFFFLCCVPFSPLSVLFLYYRCYAVSPVISALCSCSLLSFTHPSSFTQVFYLWFFFFGCAQYARLHNAWERDSTRYAHMHSSMLHAPIYLCTHAHAGTNANALCVVFPLFVFCFFVRLP